MAGQSLGRQQPGQVIKAGFLNGIALAVERVTGLRVSAGLGLHAGAGVPTIMLEAPVPILARIIARGTGAVYSWQQVVPGSTAGTFADAYLSGSATINAAVELNGNASVPAGTRVELKVFNGQWIFRLGPCVPPQKPPGIPPLPPQDHALLIPPPNPIPVLGATQIALAGGSHQTQPFNP